MAHINFYKLTFTPTCECPEWSWEYALIPGDEVATKRIVDDYKLHINCPKCGEKASKRREELVGFGSTR